jgi:putative ABC transport system permease protein
VSDGHRETLGLRLRRGRFLSLDEVEGARKVAVVNQTLAARYFGEDDPIGRTIQISNLATLPQSPVASPVFEIVGIVADSKNRGIQESALPEVIVPHTLTGSFQRGILVRTSGRPDALQNAVKGAIWQVDRGVGFTDVASLTDILRRYSYAEPRLVLVILTVFACVGLVLVALGVFSVVAYSVARQTHEIGIRMALGAERLDVLRMVLRTGLLPVGVGVTIGVGASLGLTRVLSSYLFGVTPHDPVTFAAVVGVVVVAGIAACYFPARRAARVDPLVALRYE